MPRNILPSKIVVFQRDEVRDNYLRDYSIRNPTASTAVGQQPYVDASVQADSLVPVYANAVTLGNGLAVQTMTTAQLDNEIARLGSARIGAVGGSGYVLAAGSAGGGVIFAGDEIKTSSGLRYQCTATGVYLPGAFVPILGLDTGPTTNQIPGTIMTWTSQRPGISATAIVATQSNGTGIAGGAVAEQDLDLVLRIIALRSNPPASGNDADFQAAILKAPGLSIQQPFTFPCIVGPGSMGFSFTLRPSSPGANRIPSASQLESVRAFLVGRFPKDDGVYACLLVAAPVTVYLQATWAPQAAAWTDATTWPLYVAGDPVLVSNAVAPTATTARLTTTGTVTTTPQVGQTIAFYDAPNAYFRRKKILTVAVVTAGVTWDLVFDTSNAASDTSYTPVAGQPACPWSDSLQSLVTPAVAYFDLLGPGEQVSSFFDPGYRQRRSPQAPAAWPSTLTNRILQPLFALSTVSDITMLSPAVPYAPATGTPGVSSNLLTLGALAAFP
jgi:uncharacterized phage protein gp47/JayE